ncbi:hypothetical protein PAESOLCIP111_03134 [Paenibacillus solanacearum]|uniref:HEAT repeat domain-containing protein n=1 Tax=Paenibacillus solanacearum TaxID=2048548 RepID=A0A916NJ61_9BACL|nr:HEAT repeat domain-containing protein [Paenibacillus solanacearum]CAG7629768.1 hypothetical protein PAESOLCIP111_03134 [Paenibacillus solanacearum]
MSIPILVELQQEVRRLLIAGGGMAADDLRLSKWIPQLERLGGSAPVFHRLAEAAGSVVKSEPGGSAAKLLELNALVQSVMYTQGRTETKEERVPLEGTDARLATALPYRKLRPLIEALTQKGQGRLEQLRQAYEEALFEDFRVIPAAVAALDDSYADIPEFLQRHVIPQYGAEAVPALRRQFRPDGGKGDTRRLELLHGLLPEPDTKLLLTAAVEGSTEVRAAATELLGDDPAQEAFVLEQADDKKKEIRRAALYALSRLGTAAAMARLYRALTGKDRDIAIEPVRLCEANDLTLSVIADAERQLERIVRRTAMEEAVSQLLADIASLHGKRMPETAGLLQKLLSTPEFIVPETEAAQEAAAALLLELDMPEADRFAVTLHEAYGRKFIGCSLKAAVKILPPADVYERYGGDLKDKKRPAAKELLRALYELTQPLDEAAGYASEDGGASERQPAWDPRWIYRFAALDEEELVCRLVTGPDRKIAAYLIKKCEGASGLSRGHTAHMLLALTAMQAPETPELVMQALEKGGGRQLYYLDRVQQLLLTSLPNAYADRLRQFAETVTYSSAKNELLEIAELMTARPEPAADLEPIQKGQGLWGWIKSTMS